MPPPENDQQPESSVLPHEDRTDVPAKERSWSNADVIRQVEFYFSDANLPTDSHLLGKCGGHENIPVSIRSICGFPRMRKYRPYTEVVEALKLSTKLEVIDGKFIRRRTPLTLPLKVEPKQKEVNRREALAQEGVTKGSFKPTGFEEYYTDPPITPETYEQEREIYDQEQNVFSDRIERAVQRYMARRTFREDTARIFNGWMKFGGIEQRPRISGQLSKDDMEDLTAEDIAERMATHWCFEDIGDEYKFIIDFEGVAMAFFSSYAPAYLSTDLESPPKIDKATNILRNFYNYLLTHDVAPDWKDSINAARALCTRACIELTGIYHLRGMLRGSFNTACSILFGSDRDKMDAGKAAEWGDDFRFKPAYLDEVARIIVKTAIAAQGTEAQFAAVEENKELEFTVVDEKTLGLEVVSIIPADPEVHDLYAHHELSGAQLLPLGKVVLKPWLEPDFVEYDLPASLKPTDPTHPRYLSDETYTLWLEDDILQHFHASPLTTHRPTQPPPRPSDAEESESPSPAEPAYVGHTEPVGTKLVATLKKLRLAKGSKAGTDSNHEGDDGIEGIWFLDSFEKLYPSFYTVLPNELMRGYKRPAPHRKLLEAFGLTYDQVDDDGVIREIALDDGVDGKDANKNMDEEDSDNDAVGAWD
ncbi:MAG: hypothetical protein Q9165_005976 [Trypethelium subeluteriae]